MLYIPKLQKNENLIYTAISRKLTTYNGIKFGNYLNTLFLENVSEAELNLALAVIHIFHIWVHFR